MQDMTFGVKLFKILFTLNQMNKHINQLQFSIMEPPVSTGSEQLCGISKSILDLSS
jgi:hypothetical protein